MKKVSNKQAAINARLRAVYQKIDSERSHVCEGCGLGGLPVSHSHVISQKRCKHLHKPELIWDIQNIYLECYGSSMNCHEKWENGNYQQIKDMLNFRSKLDYLKIHDRQGYMKIVLQMQ